MCVASYMRCRRIAVVCIVQISTRWPFPQHYFYPISPLLFSISLTHSQPLFFFLSSSILYLNIFTPITKAHITRTAYISAWFLLAFHFQRLLVIVFRWCSVHFWSSFFYNDINIVGFSECESPCHWASLFVNCVAARTLGTIIIYSIIRVF